MTIVMTERAARHIVAQVGAGFGLRFGVKQAGCTGLAYVFDIARETVDGEIPYLKVLERRWWLTRRVCPIWQGRSWIMCGRG